MRTGVWIILALLAGCASAPESPYEFDEAALAGMVYDLDSRPVGGLLVSLTDLDPAPVAQTDVLGRFLLPGVPRGAHHVRAELAGFETAESDISFLDRTQILYLRVASADQILSRAVTAAESGEWSAASALLERAASLAGDDPRVPFVRAAAHARAGRYEEARAILEALLEGGFRRPSVLLLLADLHEHAFADPEGAARHLRAYLALRDDPRVAERLAELTRDGPAASEGR